MPPGPRRDARGVGLLPGLGRAGGALRPGGRRDGRFVNAPARTLSTTRGELLLSGRPLLMGIVNATPDSFSDGGLAQTLEARTELARTLLADGAVLIDIGGESGVTNRPPVTAEEEIERVVPLIEQVAGGLGALVSVD